MTVPGRTYREAARFEAFAHGPRLRCIAEPAGGRARGVVLLLPPFAEEMNKSRRMCALLARGLAADGWRVVRIDLFGCGDSAGSMRDATWQQWYDDLRDELNRHLCADSPSVWLWALRAGALFIPELLAAAPSVNLLLWQPVLSGKTHLSQFLRLQTAGAMLSAGKAGQPTAASTLAAGDVAEVAGYELPPAVARGLQSSAFDVPSNFSGRIAWLEVSMSPGALPGVATQRAIDRLREAGHSVSFEEVAGVPFWQSVEVEQNDKLLARTRSLVEQLSGDRRDAAGPFALSAPAASAPDGDQVLQITCEGVDLVSVLSAPGTTPSGIGVVVIVGGPQYRVGSHRQFVELARALARAGHHVLRYDSRGMGDSDGVLQGFEAAVPDVLAAIDALLQAAPQVQQVVLWGLCDAASIALMSAAQRRAVTGLVLANPWVRDATSLANVTVKQYYRSRLLQGEFWRKLLSGRVDWLESLRSLRANLLAMLGPAARRAADTGGFRARMARGLARFQGPVLLLLSGDDLTAREFTEYTSKAPEWARLLKAERVRTVHLPQADHTFSRRAWKSRVEEETISWIDGRLRAP